MNARGVVSIEATLIMLMAFGIVVGGFFFLGVSFARNWIDFVAEEAVVCLDSGNSRAQCRTVAQTRLGILAYGKLQRFTLVTGIRRNHLRIDFQINKPPLVNFIGEKTWTISRIASGRQTQGLR